MRPSLAPSLALSAAAIALGSLAACAADTSPPIAAPAPPPVVVQPAAPQPPPPGIKLVQPRAY
jgi:hypothetical protein